MAVEEDRDLTVRVQDTPMVTKKAGETIDRETVPSPCTKQFVPTVGIRVRCHFALLRGNPCIVKIALVKKAGVQTGRDFKKEILGSIVQQIRIHAIW